MSINYLMGLCFVAVIVAGILKLLTWWAKSYPLSLTVAVVAVILLWLWCVYEERRRHTG